MVTSSAAHLTATLRSRDVPLKPRATQRASAGQTHSIAREKRVFITLPRCPKPDGSDNSMSARLHHLLLQLKTMLHSRSFCSSSMHAARNVAAATVVAAAAVVAVAVVAAAANECCRTA